MVPEFRTKVYQVGTKLVPSYIGTNLGIKLVPSWHQVGTNLVPTPYQVGAQIGIVKLLSGFKAVNLVPDPQGS